MPILIPNHLVCANSLQFRAACNLAVDPSLRPIKARVLRRLSTAPEALLEVNRIWQANPLPGPFYTALATDAVWQTLVAEGVALERSWAGAFKSGGGVYDRLAAMGSKFSDSDHPLARTAAMVLVGSGALLAGFGVAAPLLTSTPSLYVTLHPGGVFSPITNNVAPPNFQVEPTLHWDSNQLQVQLPDDATAKLEILATAAIRIDSLEHQVAEVNAHYSQLDAAFNIDREQLESLQQEAGDEAQIRGDADEALKVQTQKDAQSATAIRQTVNTNVARANTVQGNLTSWRAEQAEMRNFAAQTAQNLPGAVNGFSEQTQSVQRSAAPVNFVLHHYDENGAPGAQCTAAVKVTRISAKSADLDLTGCTGPQSETMKAGDVIHLTPGFELKLVEIKGWWLGKHYAVISVRASLAQGLGKVPNAKALDFAKFSLVPPLPNYPGSVTTGGNPPR